MITINGNASATPFSIQVSGPRSNHSVLFNSSAVRTAPSARPPAIAIGIERKLPISAAASAGTMSADRPIGVIVPWIGPTTITASVALTEAITQLTAARVWGE